MNTNSSRPSGGRSRRVGRKSKNTFVTKSGQSIKVNRNLTDKIKARKDAYARGRAQRLAGMPKSRVKRFFYRLHPKRLYHYWFSREGGIMALKLTGIGLIAGFLVLIGLFAYFRKDLPNLKDISGNNIGGSIRYYDRTGQVLLWEDFNAVKRVPVKDEEISTFVKQATIAIEDKEFFEHGGFDVRGIMRAAWNNAFGGSTQGGSTITQQLVRLTQERVGKQQTYSRKLKELILAVELERSYSKQEILVGYLNTAPYGNVQYGVESATRDYFQKSAKELTLDEAAFLAAMPQSPSYYSPYGPSYDAGALVGRQHYILNLMVEQDMITPQQRDEAKNINTIAKVKEPKPKYTGIQAPWFVLSTKDFLEEKFTQQTVKRGGWKVTTTLDLGLQRVAEEQVQKGLSQVRRQKGDVAAFVAEDVKTGQVVALVGGADFNNPEHGQNNYASGYRLPPGSSFKPYDYAALIEKTDNFGAGTVLYDSPGPLPGYPCTVKTNPKTDKRANCLVDYDYPNYPGPLSLRYALGGSRNVPAVKAMLTVGIEQTIDVAEKLGLTSGYKCYLDDNQEKEGPCYASSAIGDGAYLKLDEHVHAYTSLSRNGRVIPQTYILKIEDASGKTIDEWKQQQGEQAIREDAAYIVSDMLSDPNASYFPAGRKPQRYNSGQGIWRFAMKTGTTNDAKDGWMMGYSSRYAAGVWVGYHNRQIPMSGTMEAMTQPIWQGWMQAAHKDQKPEDWARPSGIQTLPAFVVRRHVALGSVEPSPATDLFPSWYQKKAISNQKQVIDRVSNRLATACTPNRAKQEISGGDANTFSGDRFVPGGTAGTANTNQTDEIHKCEDTKPGIRLTVSPLGDNQFQLVADVTKGTHDISSAQFPGAVTFKVNGQVVHTQQVGGPGTVTYTYTSDSPGTKDVNVEIVDSVLYDATDNGTFTASGGGGGGGSLTLTGANGTGGVGGTTSFTWSGGTGVVSIYRTAGNFFLCNSAAGNCTYAGDLSGQQVYAKDNNGPPTGNSTVN